MISFKPLFGYMAENNIKINQLAKMAEVGNSSISKLKKGQFNMRLIDRICSALDIGIKDVMRYEK